MGRIFEKRKARMFARWSKNAKAFTKIGKEISIAVRLGGPDPAGNPRLRMAIQNARALNMPKDRVQAAIVRQSQKGNATNLEEVNYEGYGPHGVAIFVETATDNPTRTVANVRSIFTKYGGAFATSGSLDYLFERKGIFTIKPPEGNLDEFELEMIDYGLEEIFESEDGLLLYTSFTEFGALQRALEGKGIEVRNAALQRLPLSQVKLPTEQEAEVTELIEALEEDEDVQHVYHTLQMAEKE